MHLADTLKKLLTILLLLAMTVTVSVFFYTEIQEVSFLQEADDEGEKNGEEKIEKEYALHATLKKREVSEKRIFRSYSCNPGLSPILDHLKPPPDFN
jgi:D-ribose pyranose/furanose isomerase RbsD